MPSPQRITALVDDWGHGKRAACDALIPLVESELESAVVGDERSNELLQLDEALDELTKKYPRKGRRVELRFYGGLTVEEPAEVLKVDARTVKRDWLFARAWLHNWLSGGG